MQYLNIVYFIIISIWGWRMLKSDGGVVKSVLQPGVRLHYDGTELFWCLTFATGLLAFSLDVGLDLMALRLLVLEILCIIGISTARNSVIISLPLRIYIIYLIWLVVGLTYAPSLAYGVRVILKYCYPLLLCLFASAAVRDGEVMVKSAKLARIVAVAAVVISFVPYVGRAFPGVIWYVTARAINFISIMIFSLGMVFFSKDKKRNIFYTVLFLLPCVIWVLRTSIMGSLIAIMAFALIRWRLKAAPVIFGLIVLGVVAVFTIPALKKKMFFDENITLADYRAGKVKEDDVNTNYRAVMWKDLQRKLFEGKELTGSGTGAVQDEMYNNSQNYGNLKVPHSDFVQQKCDNGLPGLLLYGAMMVLVFLDCFRTYWKSRHPVVKLCAIVAGASLVGVYATFYSDNVVNYSMATLAMPFGFYGMMLGLRKNYDEEIQEQ